VSEPRFSPAGPRDDESVSAGDVQKADPGALWIFRRLFASATATNDAH
jgi:hypothetical protein